jgi:hypothetical protein
MSRATTKKRTRAVALNASEMSPKLNGRAVPLSIAHAGHGIAELAQELADAKKVCAMLANAEGPAERARDAIENIDSPEHTKCCQAVNDFDDVGRRAYSMADALERLILAMEPTTAGETLSLALIFAEELDVFLSDHTKDADPAVQRDRGRLQHALDAVIRGLVHGAGATSPLLDAYSSAEALRPWAEARSDATREAVPYLVKYDPVKGCLKTAEAAR